MNKTHDKDDLKKQLQSKIISRRDFLKSTAVGLGGLSLLAGCGPSEEATEVTPEEFSGSKVALWQFVRASVPTTLENWVKRSEDLKAAKYPDFELDIVDIPYASYEIKYATAFSSRENVPDIFLASLPTYAIGLGVTAPFPDDLAQRLEEHIHPSVHKFFKVGDEWHMVPLTFRVGPYLIYNTDHFKEAGLDPDEPPQTMEQLREYASKLTKWDETGEITQAGFGLRFGGSLIGVADLWMPFLHANKGRVYSEDVTTASGYINGPEAVEALQFTVDMIYEDKVIDLKADNMAEWQFAKNHCSMYFRQPYMVGWLARNAPEINYATAGMPSGKVSPGNSDFFNQGYCTYKYSENQEMVWEWWRFILNTEDDLTNATADGILPILKENLETEYVTSRPDVEAIEANLAMPDAPLYNFPGFTEMMTRVGEALVEAFTEIKQPQQALDDCATDLDKLIEQYNV